MATDALMVLANGTVMTRSSVIDALREAPPWASYAIDDPVPSEITDDVAAVIYTGTGHRSGDEDFTAITTSVYVHRDADWKLAHYQQTATT